MWDTDTKARTTDSTAKDFTCADFKSACKFSNLDFDTDCLYHSHTIGQTKIKFSDYKEFEARCLKCEYPDYKHSTIIFNTFIWCQFFNEYNARKILDEKNVFSGITSNPMFGYVTVFTAGAQIFLVEVGGTIVSTTHLDAVQWIVCIALGSLSLIVSVLIRYIPCPEDPACFSGNFFPASSASASVEPLGVASEKSSLKLAVDSVRVSEKEEAGVKSV
jgi:hypothetical protein